MYKLPEELDSKYRFVTLASLRAEQLQSGAPPRTDSHSPKPTIVAQAEVAAGLVEEWDPETEELDDAAGEEE